jgi:hypothetical protein
VDCVTRTSAPSISLRFIFSFRQKKFGRALARPLLHYNAIYAALLTSAFGEAFTVASFGVVLATLRCLQLCR